MYRTGIHEFSRTTDLYDLLKVHDLHEKMKQWKASEMSIKVTQPSLAGLQK